MERCEEEAEKFLRTSGKVEIDESYFGGRRKVKREKGAKAKIPVFEILERKRREGLY
jgi:CRISPR/Cas system-associated exonuclease Cas4 (RecB family)